MKKFLIVLGSIAVGVVLIIGIVFYATSGAVESVDGFFRSVAAGDLERAKSYLAEEFKSSTSDEELVAFLEQSGLDDYASSDWGGRSVDTSSGKLTGKVLTASGGAIPVTVTFVREGGEWKIYYIERESSGLSARAAEVALPTRTEAAEIVKATTRDFAVAVNARDLSSFHAAASDEFREQVPLQKLNESFSAFLTQDIDLTVLQDHEPMFTSEPALSADGVLALEGYFPTTPSRAWFAYRYVYRGADWKLLGIEFNVRPVEQ